LNKIVDTIVVRPNDRIRERAAKDEKILNMFKKADEDIYHLIKSIISDPGINSSGSEQNLL